MADHHPDLMTVADVVACDGVIHVKCPLCPRTAWITGPELSRRYGDTANINALKFVCAEHHTPPFRVHVYALLPIYRRRIH